MRASLALALAALAAPPSLADEPPAPPSVEAEPAAAPPSPPSVRPLPDALAKFDAGDYEGVVASLQNLFGSHAIDAVDRAQALRVYGIACVLTGRSLAAEAAFTEWLGLDPRARLDPSLVRPEAVAFFEQVRARHRGERERELERRRPRSALLNLLPPAGQLQNGQRVKFAVLLAGELALSAVSLATFVALRSSQRPDGTFPDYDRALLLRDANWISTGLLAATVLYGVIDGFVVLRRIRAEIDRGAPGLRAATDPLTFLF
jgi:hypothetical protein